MKKLTLTLLTFALHCYAFGQDDLLNFLEEQEEPTTEYVTGTFKSTRTINSVSVDIEPQGELQFMISHRFGQLVNDFRQLYGLDNAQIRLGFEYGVTDYLVVGLGRSRELGVVDASFKLRLLRQSSGEKNMPLTLVVNSALAYQSQLNLPDYTPTFTDRLYHSHQLLIARKFSDRFSLQLAPTYSHRNLRTSFAQVFDQYSFGVSARWKYSNRQGILVDYYYIANDEVKTVYSEPLSVAWFVETGGHVFQLIVSNTSGMTEQLYLSNSLGSWSEGNLYFGFNIARNFNLKKREQPTIEE